MAEAAAEARDEPAFLAERMRLVYRDLPMTITIMLINTALLAFVHRGFVSGTVLLAWFGYMALVVALRVALLLAYRRRVPQSDEAARPWLMLLLLTLFASGVGWGGGGAVLIALAPGSQQVFTAFVLGGMAAGGLPVLARIFPVYAVFVVPLLVPPVAYFVAVGGEVPMSMAAMGLIYLAFLLITAHRHQELVLGALRHAVQNRSLIDHLTGERQRALQEKARVDRLNEELRREIAERHRTEEALRGAKQAAEAASEAKSQFLANMSHELRTPLNAIIGYSEILREDALERGQVDGVEDLARINTAGRHLLTLINEVLDLARIEAGRIELHIEDFAVESVVTDVVDTVEPAIVANGNRLIVDCAPDIRMMTGDATKLRQVLSNLLSNAAKFTENGEITLEVRRSDDGAAAAERRGEWVVFRVADTGIGIPPEKLETIFEAFERTVEGRDPKYGGTGLGLAIARHYCELMDGAISVESTMGKGTEFLVRLPLSARREMPAAG